MSIVICIDAGHGGEFNGESHVYNKVPIFEKKFNLDIALLMEDEFRKYENVEVVQTRREDVEVGLKERTKYALDHHADYLISIHNNSIEEGKSKLTGTMVLLPSTHYQPENSRVPGIYDVTDRMGHSIISKIKKLGIPIAKETNNGIVRRVGRHEDGIKNVVYYDDGSVADVYPTMRLGIEAGIPTIIIKHAYISSEDDYKDYLSEWKFLVNIAKADVEGIAEALNLKEKPPRKV